MAILEAVCGKCGETFVPVGDEPEELIHGWNEEKGEYCGGLGTVTGEWVRPEPEPELNSQERIENTALEGLVKRYTDKRDWPMVAAINALYGRVLEDRIKDKHQNAS